MNRLTYELGHKGTGEYEPNPHNIPISNYISCINKLGKLEDLLEKYEIEDLVELEMALNQYYHRYDNVQTRRVEDND